MTAIEETTEASTDAAAEAAPVQKFPKYRDLALATWKLAFKLSDRYRERDYRDTEFCTAGTDEYLDHFGLPKLGDVRDLDQAESYFDAWLKFKYWNQAELSEEDDQAMRDLLVRALRAQLAHKEPASRTMMNSWLDELGLEPLQPQRVFGNSLRIGVRRDNEIPLSAREVQEALRQALPDLDVQVDRW